MSISRWEELSCCVIINNTDIVNRAKIINKLGFGIKDSLHLSCAIEGKAKYYITVDKGIIKKRDLINDIIILNPIEFIEMEDDL